MSLSMELLHHLVERFGGAGPPSAGYFALAAIPARYALERQDRLKSHTPGVASHSTIIRSAHSTSDTKMAGLPNFAPQVIKSISVTPRAREQAPQEKTGMCLATTFSRISLSGGQPTGMTASTVALRIR